MHVMVDGAKIDAAIDGRGDPVVLLAGFPMTREIWDETVRDLSAESRVIRIDLRGTGRSDVTGGPYLMEALASDVAVVLDALGIERAAIVGHSLGGYVAMAFARMYVERVTRLGLVCSRLDADGSDTTRARETLANQIERENSMNAVAETYIPRLFSANSASRVPPAVERVRSMIATMQVRGAAALLRGMAMRVTSRDFAADLDVPVYIAGGSDDEIVPPPEIRDIAAAFPNARYDLFAQSAHVPMLEEPGPFASALRDFLR
ncbi:MAG: alpha/beta hydrolase [Candidatus Eremiobacteraeota bacterium]|nr:alpha/beta hydrolase [Candidatus Eremiobacteraeota bacterium]